VVVVVIVSHTLQKPLYWLKPRRVLL